MIFLTSSEFYVYEQVFHIYSQTTQTKYVLIQAWNISTYKGKTRVYSI
jgi:hypothetical protein